MEEVATAADALGGNRHSLLTPPHHGFAAIMTNHPLLAAFISCAIAQLLKVFTHWYVRSVDSVNVNERSDQLVVLNGYRQKKIKKKSTIHRDPYQAPTI